MKTFGRAELSKELRSTFKLTHCQLTVVNVFLVCGSLKAEVHC